MPYELIVVGASLGGLTALGKLLGALPADFGVPLAIVQHRHRDSNGGLRSVLQRTTALRVCEAEDKQPLEPGAIYLAPADYHLLIEPGACALSVDEPVLFARPAIDVLFESAADAYTDRLIGVILTGASEDGAAGVAAIKAVGGCVIVQEPTLAECPVMPLAAIAAAPIDHVLPLPAIAPLLVRLGNPALHGGL